MNNWNNLTMAQKAELMNIYVSNGITNINDIKDLYNSFKYGGDNKEKIGFNKMLKELSSNGSLSDVQKKRLAEYIIRSSGGNAMPIGNGIIYGYNQLYDEILNSEDPIEEIIDNYNYTIGNDGVKINNYDGTIEGRHDYDNYDIVDAVTSDKAPYNGKLLSDKYAYGPYKNYVENNYKDRGVRAYSYGKSNLNKKTIDYLNKTSYTNGDNVVTIGAHTNNDIPFYINNGKNDINYDGAGHIMQFIVGEDGKVYHRQSDIYDFNSKQYKENWGYLPGITKRLDALDGAITPVILYNPWQETTKDSIKNLDTHNRVGDGEITLDVLKQIQNDHIGKKASGLTGLLEGAAIVAFGRDAKYGLGGNLFANGGGSNNKTKYGRDDLVDPQFGSHTYYDAIKLRKDMFYDKLLKRGLTHKQIQDILPLIITQSVVESGYKLNDKNNNFGGMRYKGKTIKYDNIDDFANAYIDMLDEKFNSKDNSWRNAKSVDDWARAVNLEGIEGVDVTTEDKFNEYRKTHPDAYLYAPAWENGGSNYLGYKHAMNGRINRVKAYLDMINQEESTHQKASDIERDDEYKFKSPAFTRQKILNLSK